MANGSGITNKDLYEAINELRKEISHRLEKVEEKVEDNTAWRNQLTGKIAVLFIIIGAGINLAMDWLREKIGQ